VFIAVAAQTARVRHDVLPQPHVRGVRIASVMWWLVYLPLDTRVAGSNPAEAMDF
jgi:hypothetical protein